MRAPEAVSVLWVTAPGCASEFFPLWMAGLLGLFVRGLSSTIAKWQVRRRWHVVFCQYLSGW